jgi:WD40 repeat protein
VRAVVAAQSARAIFVAGADNTVQMWDLATNARQQVAVVSRGARVLPLQSLRWVLHCAVRWCSVNVNAEWCDAVPSYATMRCGVTCGCGGGCGGGGCGGGGGGVWRCVAVCGVCDWQHDAPISHCFWVAQSNFLVTGSWDKTLRFWDLRTPSPQATVAVGERVYGMDCKYPCMVVGAAETRDYSGKSERKAQIFDLQNPTRPVRVRPALSSRVAVVARV